MRTYRILLRTPDDLIMITIPVLVNCIINVKKTCSDVFVRKIKNVKKTHTRTYVHVPDERQQAEATKIETPESVQRQDSKRLLGFQTLPVSRPRLSVHINHNVSFSIYCANEHVLPSDWCSFPCSCMICSDKRGVRSRSFRWVEVSRYEPQRDSACVLSSHILLCVILADYWLSQKKHVRIKRGGVLHSSQCAHASGTAGVDDSQSKRVR